MRGELGLDVARVDPPARQRQQPQAGIGLDLAEQGQRLAAHEHQRVDLAGAQAGERLGLGQCGHLDVEPELIEDDVRGHEGAAAFGAEIDLAAAQLVDRGEDVAREDVDLLVVQFGDVGDLILDAGIEILAPVEFKDVRLDDRNVDAAQQQEILDVAHRALADHRQHAQVVAVVESVGEIRGDPDVGPCNATRDDPDGGLVDQIALTRDFRLLGACSRPETSRHQQKNHEDASQDPHSAPSRNFYPKCL